VKKLLALAGALALVCAVSAMFFVVRGARAAQATAACTPTGFVRDGINLTAALVNPTGAVKGKVDATGCNIGVYFGQGAHGTISGAEIFGANYFGVVNDGGNVTVTQSKIHDIGERPLNGTQHGVGIYFTYGSSARGTLTGNTLWNYQKGGIVVNASLGGATIANNTVTGQGPVNYIAQNGIQIGYGASAVVTGNVVTGNSYTGANWASSGGIIVVGGDYYGGALTTDVKIINNQVSGADIGIYLSQYNADLSYPSTPTNIFVNQNTITDAAVNNTTGWDGVSGYQAGISDVGDGDTLNHNDICGAGYATHPAPPVYTYAIDDTYTSNIVERDNTFCGARSSGASAGSNASTLNAATANPGGAAAAVPAASAFK
jgi:parallel beta-helix repeat protein